MEHAEHGNSNAPMEYQSETGRLNILGFWIFLGQKLCCSQHYLQPSSFFKTEQQEVSYRTNCLK